MDPAGGPQVLGEHLKHFPASKPASVDIAAPGRSKSDLDVDVTGEQIRLKVDGSWDQCMGVIFWGRNRYFIVSSSFESANCLVYLPRGGSRKK